MQKVDVIIIGAGAAGLMCAGVAGGRGRRVVVLEAAEKIGKKILISGGGRCNFTNIYAAPENYLSENPHFCKSALAAYTAQDFVKLVESYNIKYHEKKLGQLFCEGAGSAREIVRLLETECGKSKVEIRTNTKVTRIEKTLSADDRRDCFTIETTRGAWTSDSLVIACGGLSFPKIGATDFGYSIARKFGLRVTQTKPALVPLTWRKEEAARWQPLSGVSFAANVSFNNIEFDENILLTHRGLSGPAVLQISSYWNNRDALKVSLLPDADEYLARHRTSNAELATVLSERLPKRLAHEWCAQNATSKPMNRFSSKELARLAEQLNAWEVKPHGTEGYAKAEVTLGGICTDELSSKTMEAKRVGGLYFIGEVVDVTGHLGGYNFQWAWSSGYVAGQSV